MKEIITKRLVLLGFRESDYDDLFEYLSQLENDEFVGCVSRADWWNYI